jgi:hypothetical protein
MRNFFNLGLAFTFFMYMSCGSSPSNLPNNEGFNTTDENAAYGYSEKNPIKVGGISNNRGPINQRKYLGDLTGPNGESVWFQRVGSCCGFKSKNSPFGGGMLDKYAVTYEGKNDTVILYLNMYDKGELKAPSGFKFER